MWIRMMEKKLNPTRTKGLLNHRQQLQIDMKVLKRANKVYFGT